MLFSIIINAEQKSKTPPVEISENVLNNCFLELVHSSDGSTTVKEIKKQCNALLTNVNEHEIELSNIEKRLIREVATENNSRVITPHKRSYFLPFSYIDAPNNVKTIVGDNLTDLDNLEAKFQISFKAPIKTSLFTELDALYFGFTIKSYWQMYNSEYSSPFRETNYQPELFYSIKNDWQIGNWKNQVNFFGFEHQSNGRSQFFSRSWNRIYANFVFEKDDWVVSFKPWYRIPEKDKEFESDPEGDDNPDIHKYMGNFELTTVYHWNEQNFSLMLRNNLRSNNRGAVQLDWSFPIGKRFKGYLQYFNGYGESLIDYNYSEQRLGLGILLSDFF